ncbi:hypothetical protein TNIN_116211 [Trichonephila inaurata madagascariensis]|uniref:Uncharacterized protein n=1 Tax=Trichonephila inaurata madagascariensis TaxID=2747483 RepID=A0A8X6WSK2_9ARAC|nr:hypothetical protein TNIN_116211 [Trichonephila inaurata madagascariensis]
MCPHIGPRGCGFSVLGDFLVDPGYLHLSAQGGPLGHKGILLGWIILNWTGLSSAATAPRDEQGLDSLDCSGLSSAALGGQGLDSLLVIFLFEGPEETEEGTLLFLNL